MEVMKQALQQLELPPVRVLAPRQAREQEQVRGPVLAQTQSQELMPVQPGSMKKAEQGARWWWW